MKKVVYEIMYRYINPEVSLAYPERVFKRDIYPGRRYYTSKRVCDIDCKKINRKITNL